MDEKKTSMTIQEKHDKAARILDILDHPPAKPMIHDPDTILADVLDDIDSEVTGIARELIQIWYRSTDKINIEALFELLTGVSFEDYLDKAVSGSTSDDGDAEGGVV